MSPIWGWCYYYFFFKFIFKQMIFHRLVSPHPSCECPLWPIFYLNINVSIRNQGWYKERYKCLFNLNLPCLFRLRQASHCKSDYGVTIALSVLYNWRKCSYDVLWTKRVVYNLEYYCGIVSVAVSHSAVYVYVCGLNVNLSNNIAHHHLWMNDQSAKWLAWTLIPKERLVKCGL